MTTLSTLAEALTPVRDLYRPLLDAAAAWQAGRDRTSDPDHLALICVGADSGSGDATPVRWTRTGVYAVLRCHIPNWCSTARCLWPAQLPEAMWDWFDFLDETGRLHPESDPLGELRKPLLCYGGLDPRGRRLPGGAASTVVCECFVPYRETAEILLQLTRDVERGGTEPLELLRGLVGRRSTGRPRWGGRVDDGPDDPEEGDLAWARGW